MVALYIDGDISILEQQQQQPIHIKPNSQHDLPHTLVGLEFRMMQRGWILRLCACSFSCGLKAVAPHLITFHSPLKKCIAICLVALQMIQQ
jgi:hypothetical protein